MKYFLSYGFLGGELNGTTVRKLLEKSGHKEAGSLEHAEIVIAHSAGCWSLPPTIRPKLVFYIGLPLARPGILTAIKNYFAVNWDFCRNRSLRAAMRYYWLGFFYLLTQPRRNFRIMRHARASKFNNYTASKIVMIRNRWDVWATPSDLADFAGKYANWAFVSLSGSHDNIWEDPKIYVDIVDTFAKQTELA